MQKGKNDFGLFIKITEEEDRMVKKMKSIHCINMSQFIRNAIREFYGRLENKNGSEKIHD